MANALPCGPNSMIGGIYPTICLINHSCLPNAHNSWNSDTKYKTIHAIRYINAREEITIFYNKRRTGPNITKRLHLIVEGIGLFNTILSILCSAKPEPSLSS
jgi:hypothetical protein